MTITSIPDSVLVYKIDFIKGDELLGTTPLKYNAGRRDNDLELRFEKEGYEEKFRYFRKYLTGAFVMNIIFWPGFFVDWATGSMHMVADKRISVALRKDPDAEASTILINNGGEKVVYADISQKIITDAAPKLTVVDFNSLQPENTVPSSPAPTKKPIMQKRKISYHKTQKMKIGFKSKGLFIEKDNYAISDSMCYDTYNEKLKFISKDGLEESYSDAVQYIQSENYSCNYSWRKAIIGAGGGVLLGWYFNTLCESSPYGSSSCSEQYILPVTLGFLWGSFSGWSDYKQCFFESDIDLKALKESYPCESEAKMN